MTYLVLLCVLVLLIAIHELGHFWAAKWVGIPIKVFSVGFGPTLLRKKLGHTQFQIALIPLGGYVMPESTDLSDVPIWKRIVFIAGGPLASLILPLFLFLIINLGMNGFSWQGAIVEPFVQLWNTIGMMFSALGQILGDPSQASGVVGMFYQVESEGIIRASAGIAWINVIHIAALLTINLGVLNLLPIPVLDGGKILMYLIEWMAPNSSKFQILATNVSVILIFLLMIGLVVKDIAMIIGEQFA